VTGIASSIDRPNNRALLGAHRPGIASSTQAAHRPGIASSIEAIDQRRNKLVLAHAQLCRRAGISEPMWWELRHGHRRPADRTVRRLEQALDELAAARPPRQPAVVVRLLFSHVAADVARRRGVPCDGPISLDFGYNSPRDPAWLAMAQVRRLAMYVLAVEFDIANADIARALGCSRQNVKQARDAAERWRDEDPAADALIEAIARQARGDL
jgi:hypothetical protein